MVVLPDLSPLGTLEFPPDVLESNAALRTYIELYFYPPLDSFYRSQAIVCTVCMCLCTILTVLVIGKRLREKSVWIVRIQQTRRGKLLALNSVVSFLAIEASFVTLWSIYIWVAAPDAHITDLRYRNYWQSLVYLSLWCGAWASGWGTLFLAPSSLSAATSTIFANGHLCNMILIGVPTLVTGLMIGLTIVGGRSFFDAATQWQRFDANIALQDPSGSVSEATSEAAMAVWRSLCEATRWTGISYTCWSSLSLLLLIFYGGIAGILLILIRRQIYEQISLTNAVRGRSGDVLPISTWNATATAAAMAEDESRMVASTFFPPVKAQPKARIDTSSSPDARIKVLKSAYNLILVLYGCVCSSLVALSGCALFMSTIYPQSQRDPIAMGKVWSRAHIFSMWVINIAGCLTIIAIASKTFENFVPSDEKSVGQRSSKFSATRLGRRAVELLSLPRSRRTATDSEQPSYEGGSVSLLPQSYGSPDDGTPEGSRSPSSTFSPDSYASSSRPKRKGASFLALETMMENEDNDGGDTGAVTPHSMSTISWREKPRLDPIPDMRWVSQSPGSLLPPPRPAKRAPTIGHQPPPTAPQRPPDQTDNARGSASSEEDGRNNFPPLTLKQSPLSHFRV